MPAFPPARRRQARQARRGGPPGRSLPRRLQEGRGVDKEEPAPDRLLRRALRRSLPRRPEAARLHEGAGRRRREEGPVDRAGRQSAAAYNRRPLRPPVHVRLFPRRLRGPGGDPVDEAGLRPRRLPFRPVRKPAIAGKGKAAVFGAGPAGLSCAHYLALEGYPVTVFDERPAPGGVPANVIPAFRISSEDIAADIGQDQGPRRRIQPSADPGSVDLDALKQGGYTAIVIASGRSGAAANCRSRVPASRSSTRWSSWQAAHAGALRLGRASTATRPSSSPAAATPRWTPHASRHACPGKPAVSILYRRIAGRDAGGPRGVRGWRWPTAWPIPSCRCPSACRRPPAARFPLLRVREMTLGEPDASGRRVPVPSGPRPRHALRPRHRGRRRESRPGPVRGTGRRGGQERPPRRRSLDDGDEQARDSTPPATPGAARPASSRPRPTAAWPPTPSSAPRASNRR